jgi:hypothetical protein
MLLSGNVSHIGEVVIVLGEADTIGTVPGVFKEQNMESI